MKESCSWRQHPGNFFHTCVAVPFTKKRSRERPSFEQKDDKSSLRRVEQEAVLRKLRSSLTLSCSAITREKSPCNRGKRTQRPTAGQGAESERLGTLRPEWDVSIQAFPSRLRDRRRRSRRGGRKIVSQPGWTTPRRWCPPDTTGLMYT